MDFHTSRVLICPGDIELLKFIAWLSKSSTRYFNPLMCVHSGVSSSSVLLGTVCLQLCEWCFCSACRPGFAQLLDELQRMQQLLPKPSSVVGSSRTVGRSWHKPMQPSFRLEQAAAAVAAGGAATAAATAGAAVGSPLKAGGAAAMQRPQQQQQRECEIGVAGEEPEGAAAAGRGPGAGALGSLVKSPLGRWLAGHSTLEASPPAATDADAAEAAGAGMGATGAAAAEQLSAGSGVHASPRVSLGVVGDGIGNGAIGHEQQQQQEGHDHQQQQEEQLEGFRDGGTAAAAAAGGRAEHGGVAGSVGTSTMMAEQLRMGVLQLEGTTMGTSTGEYIDNYSTYTEG